METSQKEALNKMSAAEKFRVACRLYESARQLKRAGLRTQHPEWTEDEIEQALRKVFQDARG